MANVARTLLFAIVCLVACESKSAPTYVVSMTDLLTRAELYQDKHIVVTGYLESGPALRLYLTQDHAAIRDYASSIIISDTDAGALEKSDCPSNYASICGVLSKMDQGQHLISQVTKILIVPGLQTCWESKTE